MTGAETVPRGIVVVAHGGRAMSTVPVTAAQPAVLRMIPLARAIRRAVHRDGIEVWRPLFGVRGWNGPQASPVTELARVLDGIRARFDNVPVVLAGHSMGARIVRPVPGHGRGRDRGSGAITGSERHHAGVAALRVVTGRSACPGSSPSG